MKADIKLLTLAADTLLGHGRACDSDGHDKWLL